MPNHAPVNTKSLVKERGWVTLRTFARSVAEISYPTGLRWCKLEMITYIQVGGTKRIYEEEIVRFLKEGTHPPNPEKLAAEKAKREEYKQNAEQERLNERKTFR